MAVIEGSSIISDAVHEIFELELQSLRLFHSGCPHIPRTVTYQQFIDTLAVRDLYTFVVNLDLLVGLQVIPYEHLLLAADQGRPNFYRREPVDIDVRHYLVWKVHGDECQVCQAIQMRSTRGDDGLGLLLNDVIHDGHIVRSEVPNYVDVMLEEAEVYPRGIEIIKIPQGSVVNELAD